MADDHPQRLLAAVQRYSSCAVAFSGGVDSAVVAAAAARSMKSAAVAVTAVGPSLPQSELEIARRTARSIGIRHVEIPTDEGRHSGYRQNGKDRCFHCKNELYSKIREFRLEFEFEVIFNGTNADDRSDYRPGLRAADEHRVFSPLAECGLGKQAVREIAKEWKLEVWDKPAMPCLASRIAYGEAVTPERLHRIELAEQWLANAGFVSFRVRHHPGDLARIEVEADAIGRLCESAMRMELNSYFRSIGFQFVTIDLAGLSSGSLNRLIEIGASHTS